MPLHDTHLRVTPFQRAFPDPEARDRHLDAIAAEVEERGMGAEDPGAFALMTATRRALAELRDPQTEDDGGHTHAVLFFHVYHLQNAGAEHLLATVPVSRWAVEGTGGGEAKGGDGAAADGEEGSGSPTAAPDGGSAPPGLPDAVYVQLPQHLFWVREDPEERPLSLDGFFWTVTGESLHLLGVVDFQPGGEGIRVLPLPAVPHAERDSWLQEEMRPEGDDFRSEIPGSELEGLYELRTAGELLKLAARLERFLVRFPEGVEEGPAPEPEGADSGETLPYRRLVLE